MGWNWPVVSGWAIAVRRIECRDEYLVLAVRIQFVARHLT